MRSAIALAIFATLATGCASNRQWEAPSIAAQEDYAEVSGFRIEKAGVTTPVFHLYIATKAAGKVDFYVWEKLHTPNSDGDHLYINTGYRGFGTLFATFTGDAARRLLDACRSAEALADAQRYHLTANNSNEWVKDRLKQAGLWETIEHRIPWGAIGE